MIIKKLNICREARGAVEYALGLLPGGEKKKASVLCYAHLSPFFTFSADPQQFVAEVAGTFNSYGRLRPAVTDKVITIVMAFNPYDTLPDARMREIVRECVSQLQWADVPYLAVRHSEKRSQHVHIIASRIDIHGNSIPLGNNYSTFREVEKIIDKKYELLSGNHPLISSMSDIRRYHSVRDRTKVLLQKAIVLALSSVPAPADVDDVLRKAFRVTGGQLVASVVPAGGSKGTPAINYNYIIPKGEGEFDSYSFFQCDFSGNFMRFDALALTVSAIGKSGENPVLASLLVRSERLAHDVERIPNAPSSLRTKVADITAEARRVAKTADNNDETVLGGDMYPATWYVSAEQARRYADMASFVLNARELYIREREVRREVEALRRRIQPAAREIKIELTSRRGDCVFLNCVSTPLRQSLKVAPEPQPQQSQMPEIHRNNKIKI